MKMKFKKITLLVLALLSVSSFLCIPKTYASVIPSISVVSTDSPVVNHIDSIKISDGSGKTYYPYPYHNPPGIPLGVEYAQVTLTGLTGDDISSNNNYILFFAVDANCNTLACLQEKYDSTKTLNLVDLDGGIPSDSPAKNWDANNFYIKAAGDGTRTASFLVKLDGANKGDTYSYAVVLIPKSTYGGLSKTCFTVGPIPIDCQLTPFTIINALGVAPFIGQFPIGPRYSPDYGVPSIFTTDQTSYDANNQGAIVTQYAVGATSINVNLYNTHNPNNNNYLYTIFTINPDNSTTTIYPHAAFDVHTINTKDENNNPVVSKAFASLTKDVDKVTGKQGSYTLCLTQEDSNNKSDCDFKTTFTVGDSQQTTANISGVPNINPWPIVAPPAAAPLTIPCITPGPTDVPAGSISVNPSSIGLSNNTTLQFSFTAKSTGIYQATILSTFTTPTGDQTQSLIKGSTLLASYVSQQCTKDTKCTFSVDSSKFTAAKDLSFTTDNIPFKIQTTDPNSTIEDTGTVTVYKSTVPNTPVPTFNPCPQIATAIGPIDTDPFAFINKVFGILLSLSGAVALIIIIFNGYRLMTSQGNPQTVKKAQEGITSGIVGIVFAILSIAILQVIGVNILHLPGFSSTP